MTIEQVYKYFTDKYKKLLCRIRDLEAASGGVADGNGIYGGSGNVPDNTVATLLGRFDIIGTGAGRALNMEIGDGVSESTYFEFDPSVATVGYNGAGNAFIEFSTSGTRIESISTASLKNNIGTDLTVSGLTANFLANENQGFGDAIFINSTSEAQLGDASVIATASCIGLCTETVTTGNTGTYLLQGFARKDAWNWTPGQPIYLSLTGTTTNTLTQTAPSATNEIVQILGMAITADIIYWNPNLVQVEIA